MKETKETFTAETKEQDQVSEEQEKQSEKIVEGITIISNAKPVILIADDDIGYGKSLVGKLKEFDARFVKDITLEEVMPMIIECKPQAVIMDTHTYSWGYGPNAGITTVTALYNGVYLQKNNTGFEFEKHPEGLFFQGKQKIAFPTLKILFGDINYEPRFIGMSGEKGSERGWNSLGIPFYYKNDEIEQLARLVKEELSGKRRIWRPKEGSEFMLEEINLEYLTKEFGNKIGAKE